MNDFDSLTLALEGWFDRPLGELPEDLQVRAERALRPLVWNELSPEQRRSAALQLDYQHDPATEEQRRAWWTFYGRVDELEAELERQRSGHRGHLDDLLPASGPLKELRDQIRRMKARERQAATRYYPQRRVAVQAAEPGRYMAYPKAIQSLRERLNATPEELAAWVWLGAEAGGLTAYLNVNELDPPPQFSFGALPFLGTADELDCDYVTPLAGCWFLSADVTQFQPADRYITGQALVERWGSIPDLNVEAFVRAKVRESRLQDLHPIYGSTQAGSQGGGHLPPMAQGLFRLADVEKIEAEDLGGMTAPAPQADPADARTEAGIESTVSAGLKEFLAMPNLSPEEIRIVIVGTKTDSGLGGNNMLEVSARGLTRRVSVAEFGLTDRRTGAVNSQGVLLVGMVRRRKLGYSGANAKKVSRLREAFRSSLGISEPFFRRNPTDGWAPRFEIVDSRGAADERARCDTERRSVSLEEFLSRGGQLAENLVSEDPSESEDPTESEGDAADRWLRENDPTA